MKQPVLLYGNRSLCKMLYLDSLNQSEIEVVAFCVDQAYLDPSGSFCDKPQVAFETIEAVYPPKDYAMIVLEGTLKGPGLEPLYTKAKAKGYRLLNYVSPKAVVSEPFIWGDNNVIFELAYVGHHGKMGSNNLIRQQVYLGHDFVLGDHVILNSGVKVGGFCTLEDHVFVGLGATVINDLHLSKHSVIGAGSVLINDTLPYSKNIGVPAKNTGSVLKSEPKEASHD